MANININNSHITPNMTFRKLCYMNIQQLTNFPFIEEDFDFITDYQFICQMTEYLNSVIKNSNDQNDSITNLYNAFLDLQTYMNNSVDSLESAFNTLDDYVRNYFANLDVQDEINNKLDEMVEDGTLINIIASYLQTQKIYNTYVEMVADASNLANGLRVQTLGYYTLNDGGGAFYVISNTVDVTKYQEQIGSFYAEMIIENDTICFPQLGAKPNDDTFDNKNYLLKYQTICNTLGKQIKLIIPNGTWYFSPTFLSRIGGFNIEGVGGYAGRTFVAPIIHAINNQDYIWKFGGLEDMGTDQIPYANNNSGNNIKNLVFMSADYQINYGCLVIEYANYGFYDKLFFNQVTGTGLYIRSSWENYFGMLNFRSIKDMTKPCLMFAHTRSVSGVSGNISSSSFDKMIFESISGDCIKSELGSAFVNNQIGEINVEYGWNTGGADVYNITSETDLSTATPLYLFNGNMSGVTIEAINFTGSGTLEKYTVVGDTTYYFKSLFNSIGGGSTEGYRFDVNIDKIASRSKIQILTSYNPYRSGFAFMVNNILISANAGSPKEYPPFDLLDSGVFFFYNKLLTRADTFKDMPNAIKLYKDSNGALNSDMSASGDKIVIRLSSGSTLTTGLRYPYEYSATKKTKWLIRVKTNSDGAYSFILRGTHDGSNVNKTYSATGLTPNTWYMVEVEMNYDYDSSILFINANSGNYFDTITFDGFETIT